MREGDPNMRLIQKIVVVLASSILFSSMALACNPYSDFEKIAKMPKDKDRNQFVQACISVLDKDIASLESDLANPSGDPAEDYMIRQHISSSIYYKQQMSRNYSALFVQE